MKKLLRSLTAVMMGVFMMSAANAASPVTNPAALIPAGVNPENVLFLDLKDGRVVIQMFPEIAPNHVKRIKELTREGYYNGKLWHRVIDGFMAQTGSPRGDGIGGSSKPDLKAEFNALPHERGTVSMARTGDPDSANAQFFIMLDANSSLNGQYTVWGKVLSGMQYVDNIKKGNSADNGSVTNPDKIVKMSVAADVLKTAK